MSKENPTENIPNKNNSLILNVLDIFNDLYHNLRVTFESKIPEMLSISDSLLPYLRQEKTINKEDFCNSEAVFINKFSFDSVVVSLNQKHETRIYFNNTQSKKKVTLKVENDMIHLNIQVEKKQRHVISTLGCSRSCSGRENEISCLKLKKLFLSKKHTWKKVK